MPFAVTWFKPELDAIRASTGQQPYSVCMCMYVYTYIHRYCMCVYICIYDCTHIYIYIQMYTHICMDVEA